jgi:uncharacterized integral membrane protein (TIGR00698 family)
MNAQIWFIILLCCIIAVGYAVITDIIGKKKLTAGKYIALATVFTAAILATILANLQKYVGAPIFGLFIGMIIYNVIPNINPGFKEGTTFASKKFLSLGIILVGATLSFTQMAASVRALPLILFNICLSFGMAFIVGRLALKQSNNICTMVGGGTCICGGTAIAALGSIIKASADEIGYAMTAIFLFDVISCLLYPYLAIVIGLSPEQFSFLAGTAINDTSSVTASAQQYASLMGTEAFAAGAVSIKLVRTTMLIAVALIVTGFAVRAEAKATSVTESRISVRTTIKKVFPWFVLGFLVMAVLNTLGLFSGEFLPVFFKYGSKYLITCALVGVGFKMKFKDLFTKGMKPLLLGGCTWLCLAAASLLFINIFAGYVNSTHLFG